MALNYLCLTYWSAFFVSKHTSQLRMTVVLNVHDAIAVKQGDAKWAKEAMSRVWGDETLGGKTKLKIDYPGE